MAAPMFRHDFAKISQWVAGKEALKSLKELEEYVLPRFLAGEEALMGFQYSNSKRRRHYDSVVLVTQHRLAWLDRVKGIKAMRALRDVDPDGVGYRTETVDTLANKGSFRELRRSQVTVGDMQITMRDGEVLLFSNCPGTIVPHLVQPLLEHARRATAVRNPRH